jgi:predicted nucleotidyltransferase
MRLTEKHKTAIQKSAEWIFGIDVQVFLFGSRTNDQLKGGDIDLLIKADGQKMTARNKVLFLVNLKKQLGEQNIDVVYEKFSYQKDFFFESIRNQAIRLC